ncbi:hypothetical protein Syun_015791 [Stephania yunnanensis]|uniref:Uncharacterized protein n=1 Tax=Stephania yunnanensis TaxID=152371 RepID=A0AAP0JLV4_9MAGN
MKRPMKQIASNGDEMGGFSSDREGEARLFSRGNSGVKRSHKLHSKFLTRCNGVNHAVVPRKLRSAMEKRNHEYFPPPSKKCDLASERVEQSRNNIAKKSKHIMKQGIEAKISMKEHDIFDSISKDEEEVVESLFALARMSPNGKTTRSRLDEQISAENCSPSTEKKQNPLLNSKVLEEKSVLSQHSGPAVESVNASSSFNVKAEAAARIDSSIGPIAMCRPAILLNNEFGLRLGSSKFQQDCETSLPSCKSGHKDIAPLSNDIASSQWFSGREASAHNKIPDSWLGLVPDTPRRLEKREQTNDGESCSPCVEGSWSTLHTPHSCGGEMYVHSSRSSLIKSRAILTTAAAAASTGSFTTIFVKEQVKVKRGNSWKRCATHVYISQLIKSYQTKEEKSKWPVPFSRNKLNEKPSLAHTTTCGPTGQAQSPNGVIPMGVISSLNAAALVADANGLSQGKLFQTERSVLSTSSAMYSSTTMNIKENQQNRNKLSLSVDAVIGPVATTKANDDQQATKLPMPQVHIPYLQAIFQHNQLMPVALSHYQQVQTAQSFGNPSYNPNFVIPTSLPQQSPGIWTAEDAPGVMPRTHFPKWRNGGLDYVTVPTFSSPYPSGVLGAKFSPVAEPQRLIAFPSTMDPSRGKAARNFFHGSYNGSGIRSYPDDPSHLQLLCNGERL